MPVTSIKLTISGNNVELTLPEARALWRELDELFGQRAALPMPLAGPLPSGLGGWPSVQPLIPDPTAPKPAFWCLH